MRRAERKLQLSHNVIGDDVDLEEKDAAQVETSDLRSIILGLQLFDPTEISDENSGELKVSELSTMAEKVIRLRHEQLSEKNLPRLKINSMDLSKGYDLTKEENPAFVNFDTDLDESSYISWVEKFKEASQVNSESEVVTNRRNLTEEKRPQTDAAKRKAEEKKLAKWEAQGYHSLSVKDPINPVNSDMMSELGSVQFVYGDCTHPEKVCPAEPAIIFRLVLY